jgi:hypothetical protein
MDVRAVAQMWPYGHPRRSSDGHICSDRSGDLGISCVPQSFDLSFNDQSMQEREWGIVDVGDAGRGEGISVIEMCVYCLRPSVMDSGVGIDAADEVR